MIKYTKLILHLKVYTTIIICMEIYLYGQDIVDVDSINVFI